MRRRLLVAVAVVTTAIVPTTAAAALDVAYTPQRAVQQAPVERPTPSLLRTYTGKWWNVHVNTRFSPGADLRKTQPYASASVFRESIRTLDAMIAAEAALDAPPPAVAVSSPTQTSTSSTPVTVTSSSGGWVIPTYVVMCESHGQNLAPNGATASGYYQIIDSTWKAYGGTTAEAWQAPKSEQDQVASRIPLNQWDCAR